MVHIQVQRLGGSDRSGICISLNISRRCRVSLNPIINLCMNLPRTSVISRWVAKGSLDRSVRRRQWHSAWIYGATPDVELSPNRHLPNHLGVAAQSNSRMRREYDDIPMVMILYGKAMRTAARYNKTAYQE